ncbi:MAG: penicillin-binding protein activator [Pseudomonadota bacterium]|nr:penicillin-binding protein activator [Pseudomonadota bacterium]
MRFPFLFITTLLFISTIFTGCGSRERYSSEAPYQKLSLYNVEKQSFVSQEDLDTLFMQTRYANDSEKNPLYLTIGRRLTKDSQYSLSRIILEKTNNLSEKEYQEKYTLLATSYLNLKLYDQAFKSLKILAKTPAAATLYYKLLLSWYYYEKGSFSSYLIALNDAYQHADHSPQVQYSILKTTWKSIQLATAPQVQQIQAHPNSNIQGWNQLRGIIDPINNPQVIRSPQKTLAQLHAWQNDHQDHPAAQLFKTTAETQPPIPNTDKIGLILPLTGKHKKASGLIQKGIFSALFEIRPPNQTISMYDSAQSDVSPLYKQAVTDDKMQTIIGPLSKSEIQDLLSNTQITVPTIVLNDSPYQKPLLTQYSISSNQEISQLVSNMMLSGYHHPLVLSDQSPLAQSITQDFNAQIEQQGGLVAQSKTLEPTNFNADISSALGTGQSLHRHKFIQSISPEPIRTVASKRQDIDSIFVTGETKNMRQIIPLLKYHYSGTLPIFATSSINTSSSTHKNKDMSAALFFDAPSLANKNNQPLQAKLQNNILKKIQASNPSGFHEYFRFYGLGLDAYMILQTSYLWDTLDGYLILGVNGTLSRDHDGNIHRELARMTFKNGQVSPDGRFDQIREHWKALTHQSFNLF